MLAAERETTITWDDHDRVVRIYTCRRQDITQLRKMAQYEILEEGTYVDGTPWVKAQIPLEIFSLARAVRKVRALTPEERERARQTALRNFHKETDA